MMIAIRNNESPEANCHRRRESKLALPLNTEKEARGITAVQSPPTKAPSRGGRGASGLDPTSAPASPVALPSVDSFDYRTSLGFFRSFPSLSFYSWPPWLRPGA